MKLAILSRSASSYSTSRLVEAARARGHTVEVLDILKMSIDIEAGRPRLHYRGAELGTFDVVLPRIGASVSYFGAAVLRQFEQMGVPCANSSTGLANSRDKLRSLQLLSSHQIGIPATSFVLDPRDVPSAIARVGGAPVIVKLVEGTQGVGVILADTQNTAEAMVETLHSAKQDVLIQAFVAESRGRDLRAIVVGSRVVAAMRRVAAGDEFRSNVHRGGKTEAVVLDDAYRNTAIRAAQVMGLRIAGVDMLEGEHGPQVVEVNSSPGLEGIEAASRLDIAGLMIDCVASLQGLPEVDIRQRLTARAGYEVVEVQIPAEAAVIGGTIADAGLAEQDIEVLALDRGQGGPTPNPGADSVLRAGDRLLCLGPLESLRELVTELDRRRSLPPIPHLVVALE